MVCLLAICGHCVSVLVATHLVNSGRIPHVVITGHEGLIDTYILVPNPVPG